MVAGTKHLVTVGPDGKIELREPELRPGTQVEVTVMPTSPSTDLSREEAERRLAAFQKLSRAMNLDDKKAAEWIEQVRLEREAAGP